LIRIVFGIIASLGILMALGTVLARNLVHAALFLVAFFFLVACQFVLLEAEFMAAMQVLVYIGAVAILLMFGIMLTRNIQGDETTGGHWVRKAPAAAVALALLAILVAGIYDESPVQRVDSWKNNPGRPVVQVATEKGTVIDGRSAAIGDMSRAVGIEMLQRFVVPFEVAGLLLTAALVGAIALAQSETGDEVPGSDTWARSGLLGTNTPTNGHIPPVGAGVSAASSAKLSPSGDTGATPS
jgi:NADH-quinone oxidoreductase subunit J